MQPGRTRTGKPPANFLLLALSRRIPSRTAASWTSRTTLVKPHDPLAGPRWVRDPFAQWHPALGTHNVTSVLRIAHPQELVVVVDLPLCQSAAGLDLAITERQISLHSEDVGPYHLDIRLPYDVVEVRHGPLPHGCMDTRTYVQVCILAHNRTCIKLYTHSIWCSALLLVVYTCTVLFVKLTLCSCDQILRCNQYP